MNPAFQLTRLSALAVVPRSAPRRRMKNGRKRDQTERGEGCILTAPPERRIYPAAAVPLARLPDESGVPVGSTIRLGGGAEKRPIKGWSAITS